MNHQVELQTIRRDLNSLSMQSAALEAYGDLLAGREVPSHSTLGLIVQVGLESIDPTLDMMEGGMITLRAIKDGLIRAAKAAKEALRRLFELLSSAYVKFTGNIGRVRGHYKATAKALGNLGNRVTYKKMEISGINRLSVNGAFAGDDPQALMSIKELTKYILEAYPKAVTQVARDCNREFMNLVLKQTPEQSNADVAQLAIQAFMQSLSRHLRAPYGDSQANMKELPTSFKDAGVFHRSGVLPGNYALVYTHPSDAAHRAERTQVHNYAEVINQAFTIRFVELALKTVDRSPRVVDVPSIQTLNQLMAVISEILTIAEHGDTGMRDFTVVKASVDDTIRQVAERNNNVGNANNVILHMLGMVSSKLTEPMGGFTHWLAVTLNIYLSYIDHCIAHYREQGV